MEMVGLTFEEAKDRVRWIRSNLTDALKLSKNKETQSHKSPTEMQIKSWKVSFQTGFIKLCSMNNELQLLLGYIHLNKLIKIVKSVLFN